MRWPTLVNQGEGPQQDTHFLSSVLVRRRLPCRACSGALNTLGRRCRASSARRKLPDSGVHCRRRSPAPLKASGLALRTLSSDRRALAAARTAEGSTCASMIQSSVLDATPRGCLVHQPLLDLSVLMPRTLEMPSSCPLVDVVRYAAQHAAEANAAEQHCQQHKVYTHLLF